MILHTATFVIYSYDFHTHIILRVMHANNSFPCPWVVGGSHSSDLLYLPVVLGMGDSLFIYASQHQGSKIRCCRGMLVLAQEQHSQRLKCNYRQSDSREI